MLCSAPSVPQTVFTIMEKAPTWAFSWLKAPTSAFTFKTHLRHYMLTKLPVVPVPYDLSVGIPISHRMG